MKILVTAGPTREHLDPVRFLSNRSTGKMGYAIADVARLRGHDVQLISGPVSISSPASIVCSRITTAQEMHDLVLEQLPDMDVLVMCAAVADWRPCEVSRHKLKKNAMQSTLPLVRTADILEAVQRIRRPEQIIVGFAAETHDILSYARDKLDRKGMDLIVANDVSRSDAGFGADSNAVTLIDKTGAICELPLQSKHEVAKKILDWVELHAQKIHANASLR